MLEPIKQTILFDQNAIYYGYPIEKLMEKAGQGIAKVLLKKYGRNKRIGFFCGPGNNGGDGFVAARYLIKNSQPEVYLIPSFNKIRTIEAKKNWQKFKGFKKDSVSASDITNHFDVVVECLFGTGLKDKVKEPYLSVIKKLNKLKGKKVTIDLSAPSFKPQFSISMMFAKSPKAHIVDIGYPEWLKQLIGVGEVKVLNKPLTDSHKGNNGQLLIIGGSKKYHGAVLLAAQIASRIVDLVYVSSTKENNEIIKKTKTKLAEFITIPREEAVKAVKKTNAILLGPGLGISPEAKKLTNTILKKFPNKKFVLDADALKVLDKKLLNKNCIITPHKKEFNILFGQTATKQAIKKMAKKYGCIIVVKGKEDYVASDTQFKINKTGNVGMTKGGTGDVLAGLIASFACQNDLFISATAGVFINGLAGDRLKKKVSSYYNASDLIKEIPKTIKFCEDF